MKASDVVIYRKLNGAFEFGSEHLVQQTCVVLDMITVIGSDRIHKMSEFIFVTNVSDTMSSVDVKEEVQC